MSANKEDLNPPPEHSTIYALRIVPLRGGNFWEQSHVPKSLVYSAIVK